ncbi:hypothetical protein G6F62_005019 [Rhizopus arrhizus]|nr:hypothetical protein G6F23_006536 [Rhizopus arrhizus]KAG0759281.1 hypothetical protein G6F24_009181 [Rhizopus arrhizus]KAG0908117.1 hypothetical protein G6F33_009984 [Rhizopus arrhizus]KAG0940997.1 hypothetical protein G6F32_008592 [Rhizopus arrhizus]KAG1341655.1 hypothetical protein G6F62_005019 [Rhizopus arrhizus]
MLVDLSKKGEIQSNRLLMELNSPLETPTGEQIRARPIRRVPKSERNKVFFWQQDKAGRKKRDSGWSEDPKEGVDEGLGQLAMDENGQVRYLGKSSGYYLLQNCKTYQNGAFHFTHYGKRLKRIYLVADPVELPPKDLSEHLIRLYFDHLYPFLPLFFQRQLFSSVERQVTPLLLNSIYAVASRISTDVRVRSDPALPETAGDVFFERAKKLLDASYDKPTLSTVQSLLLLASHQHGTRKSARAWLYSGMAFRMAQDLGLHRNCDHWNLSPEECERRKRVFWCCYVVDRLGSAMYGRATTFEEKDCDVPFPSVDDHGLLSAKGEPVIRLLDNFINLIKLCDILGHVLKHIYYVRSLQSTATKQIDSILTILNKRLHQWHDQLPNPLKMHPKSDALPCVAVCQLHLVYYTTLILLHRMFIPGPDQGLSTLVPCASICASAADSILYITHHMLEHNRLVYVMNYAVYYVFTAGIIFTRQASHSEKSAEEAKIKVTRCMQVLDEIELTWITASKNSQILAELSGLQQQPSTTGLNPPHTLYPNFALSQPTSMDPFAAPDIIPVDVKPFHPSFWEPSLDHWNSFSPQQEIPMYQEKHHLIHNDQHVDVLTGVCLPLESATDDHKPTDGFMSYVHHHRTLHPSAEEDGGRPSSSHNRNNHVLEDTANAYYW